MPAPTPSAEQPAMQPGDLAQFQRVCHQRNVTVRGEPDPLLNAIGCGLITVAAVLVVMDYLIKDCRVAAGGGTGKIEISRDIQTGKALQVKLLDCVTGLFNPSCDRRLERTPFGNRLQTQHL